MSKPRLGETRGNGGKRSPEGGIGRIAIGCQQAESGPPQVSGFGRSHRRGPPRLRGGATSSTYRLPQERAGAIGGAPAAQRKPVALRGLRQRLRHPRRLERHSDRLRFGPDPRSSPRPRDLQGRLDPPHPPPPRPVPGRPARRRAIDSHRRARPRAPPVRRRGEVLAQPPHLPPLLRAQRFQHRRTKHPRRPRAGRLLNLPLEPASGRNLNLYDTQVNYGGSEGIDCAIYSLARLAEQKPGLLCPSHGQPAANPAAATRRESWPSRRRRRRAAIRSGRCPPAPGR